jgi:hypothetical protein
MAKTTKRSTVKAKPATKAAPIIKTFQDEYYRDMFSLKMKPISRDYKLHFALEWVTVTKEDEDILTLGQFYNLKGINKSIVEGWVKDTPEVKEAHDFVMQIIGTRREVGALTRKLDANVFLRSAANYDSSWRDLEEWRNSMREKISGASAGNFVIEMNKMPETDLVPRRKVKDDVE